MASDRASPPALRWVALFLALCAALGLWMGFKDQMRRNPPDWYTGSSTDAPGASIADTATEAKPYDPNARNDAPIVAAPAAKVEEKADETDEADDAAADAAATGTTPAVTPAPGQPATPGTTPPATPRPKAPTVRPAPSDDPVGDILDSQKAPPEQPPVVPY